jgi:DNA-binding beta-propeller fold protein YncE
VGDLRGLEFEFAAYTGDFPGALDRPVDVAYDEARDRIYVTEPAASRVLVFDGEGRNGRIFVSDDPTRDVGGLSEFVVVAPTGVDVGADGLVYVADWKKSAVVVFSPDGEKLRELLVMTPRRVEVRDGRVFVANTGTLYIFDSEGNVLGQWGTFGRDIDQFADPHGIAIAEDGTAYIADTNNYRVIALDTDLEIVWQRGQAAVTFEEQKDRDFASQVGLTLGADGALYLVDGLKMTLDNLKKIDKNSIESIDVLNDKNSIRKYASGDYSQAVLIKLKKGSAN